jgi:hypothetical protein
VELGNSVAQNTASEGDSTNFPPPPPSDTGATPDSGPAPADTGGASTAGSDAGASDHATASAGSDSGSDAAVDDSGAGVDEETAAAADQVPADVGESLPAAGDVFTGDSEGDAQPDTQPGNSNNPDSNSRVRRATTVNPRLNRGGAGDSNPPLFRWTLLDAPHPVQQCLPKE